MICTSSYNEDFKDNKYKLVSLIGKAGFPYEYHSKLAVPKSIQEEWTEVLKSGNGAYLKNPDTIKRFVKRYWEDVLSQLDCEETFEELGNAIICSDGTSKDAQPCQVVAAWFELFLDTDVPAVVSTNGELQMSDKNHFVKQLLESTIREDMIARRYSSLRAYYLYMKGRELSKQAGKRKLECGDPSDEEYRRLREASIGYRVNSERIETESIKHKKERQYL